MAPEMATGPVENIGVSRDVYLFGATLFLIITGKPPHFGKDVTQCLNSVRTNQIREVPPAMAGELMDVTCGRWQRVHKTDIPTLRVFRRQFANIGRMLKAFLWRSAPPMTCTARCGTNRTPIFPELPFGSRNRSGAGMAIRKLTKDWPQNQDSVRHRRLQQRRFRPRIVAAGRQNSGARQSDRATAERESMNGNPAPHVCRCCGKSR